MTRLILIIALVFLTSCGKTGEEANNLNQQTIIEEKEPNLEQIAELFYEKLWGQTLIRTYGEDTGQTKIVFEKGGAFRGDYFGKIAADGRDYGLTSTAQIYYHAEEIHTSTFEGKFKIEKALDDYRYQVDLYDYKITSGEGAYDDIYYHVDFALGLDSEARYILYRPGCPIESLEKDDRLIEIAKKGSPDGEKTAGFIIYNKTDGEVFSQNQ